MLVRCFYCGKPTEAHEGARDSVCADCHRSQMEACHYFDRKVNHSPSAGQVTARQSHLENSRKTVSERTTPNGSVIAGGEALAASIPLGVSPDDERPVSDEFPIGKGRQNKWRARKSANHWWFQQMKSK